MKNLKLYIIAFLSALTVLSCKSDDDFYNTIYLSVPNLITIDTPGSYAVGDVVSFHSDFSRYLPEAGQTDLLDVYRTTEALSFGFAYRLERETAPNVWTSVLLEGDEFSVAEASYDTFSMTYSNDTALQLTQTGNYRLSFGTSFAGAPATDLISRNPQNKTAVIISTTPNDVDSLGYYHFTVN